MLNYKYGEAKMEKKVGILTFHGADNLGAVLQAYALCKYITYNINVQWIIFAMKWKKQDMQIIVTL